VLEPHWRPMHHEVVSVGKWCDRHHTKRLEWLLKFNCNCCVLVLSPDQSQQITVFIVTESNSDIDSTLCSTTAHKCTMYLKTQDMGKLVCEAFNPLPSLMLQSARDLNVLCRPKRSEALLLSYTFKRLLKKTQSFCPCSRALNRSGKGLISCVVVCWYVGGWTL
jgi:hypothetical protein